MLTKALRILKPRYVLGEPLQLRSISFSTPSPSLSAGAISCSTVDVAEISAVDAVAYPDPSGAATAMPVMMPAHLQPRVVVYDGVCHLCHGGTMFGFQFCCTKWGQIGQESVVFFCENLSLEDMQFPNFVRKIGRKVDIFETSIRKNEEIELFNTGVKWIIKVDKYRKIKFCCLQSKAAEPYLLVSGVTKEDVEKRFLFVEGLGLYHQASTAALRVLSYLPLPYSALNAFSIVPTPLRDSVYDYVANHRYDWFGKAEDCLVLKEKELLERFVDRDELINRS